MAEPFPRVVEGRRSDYTYSLPYLSGNGVVEPLREGQEVMFNGDNTVGKVIGGKLVMLTQLLGSSGTGAADLSGTVTSLVSIRTQLDALIAKLKS